MRIFNKVKKIENIDSKKLRGGYYTPQGIANFICRWAITSPLQKVLEPSCGDGNFVVAALKRFNEIGVSVENLQNSIKGVELIEEEADKTRKRALEYGLKSSAILNMDFFNYIVNNPKDRYDIVIGNPPFIRYQNFPEEHRDIALDLMRELGLKPNKLTNIWLPFLIVSASRLNQFGKLAMVIPAELFQVKYAAESRVFLARFFSRITIVTFKKLVFDDIQQEIVLLLCEKDISENVGIRVVEIDNLDELDSIDFGIVNKLDIKHLEHSTEKWTKYFLNEEEIQLLRKIKSDKRIVQCSSIMEVDVGIVTGRNNFFMLDKKTVIQRKLVPYTTPVVGRSNYIQGIVYKETDFETNSEANLPVHLFLPPADDFILLPKVCQNYILHGESMEHHKGYKCKIRKRWYITPSLWVPDAFALRQVSDYPKLIINEANASSTDTIHRVRFKTKDIDKKVVILSYLNSLTFAFSEILGRSYGGGVLTFEPSEIEELPLPILTNCNIDFEKIDRLMREKKIEDILDIIDQELLINQLKFSENEVSMLRGIWKKLQLRRVGRKKV